MMVLLPKGKWEYRGIGIVQFLWKVFSVVDNCCLKSSVVLREALHEFIERKGTGTATLEANLAQHLDRFAHDPLFRVFLGIRNAYDSLGRERCLELLS